MVAIRAKEMPQTGQIHTAIELLGGKKLFARPVLTSLDAHEVILKGLPNQALTNLVLNVPVMLHGNVMEKAIGISVRTYQRRKKDNSTKPLSQEQSGRTWKFAEILAKAIQVLGSKADAEAWLNRPAIGLNQQRPIDLIATTAGIEVVEEHLERLEYGVYA